MAAARTPTPKTDATERVPPGKRAIGAPRRTRRSASLHGESQWRATVPRGRPPWRAMLCHGRKPEPRPQTRTRRSASLQGKGRSAHRDGRDGARPSTGKANRGPRSLVAVPHGGPCSVMAAARTTTPNTDATERVPPGKRAIGAPRRTRRSASLHGENQWRATVPRGRPPWRAMLCHGRKPEPRPQTRTRRSASLHEKTQWRAMVGGKMFSYQRNAAPQDARPKDTFGTPAT
jgi:hypothetical protein